MGNGHRCCDGAGQGHQERERRVTDRLQDGYVLTTDPGRVDVDRVHRWLSDESYWAKGRDRAVVEASIAGSRSYSVFADEQQAAYARAITDGATFAWICDVFVDEPHRRRGLGGWLVESIVEDLAAAGVQRFVLVTTDAHEVYRRCGFAALDGADRWMQIDRRPTRAAPLGQDPD
jgi:GNAT superfamily N-acetyltransferase